MTQFRVPTATYRIQFNGSFRFGDATAIVPYLASLGITDLYSSPILTATPGSQHGYDVVDPHHVNPEAGGEEEFISLSDRLGENGLGLILDIVPNHMAATSENSWWMDVLENGPYSRRAQYFDIEWHPFHFPRGLERKILLPILGRPYGEALEKGELRLAVGERGLFVTYYDRKMPIAGYSYLELLRAVLDRMHSEGHGSNPSAIELEEILRGFEPVAGTENQDPERMTNTRFLKETLERLQQVDQNFGETLQRVVDSWNGTPDDPTSFEQLDSLLDRQWYRLAYWRRASEQINYRRFFDITDLVGLRIEDPEVFEARQKLILQLVDEGRVTGLRIDHIDGLYDPVAHLRKLQIRLAGVEASAENHRPYWVVVEKILARDEQLPNDFAVSGTTGYDFLNRVNDLFVSPDGLGRLSALYTDLGGIREPFDDIAYERKKLVIESLFVSETRALAARLAGLAAADRTARDFPQEEIEDALVEITASLDVYRTYIREPGEVPRSDRQWIERAVHEARHRAPRIDDQVYRFVQRVLLVDPPHYASDQAPSWLDFVMRWQQYTGRVVAKGVEDTSFYVYNRLISMNEVGGDPEDVPADPVEAFHRENSDRARQWPHTLNTTNTHDTKRSEDVRTRIDVLSELEEWPRIARRWARINADAKEIVEGHAAPDGNDELMIYQTILGVWPLDGREIPTLQERLHQFVQKAAREAKVHSSWLQPNTPYEMAMKEFVDRLLREGSRFRRDLASLHRKVAFFGFLNSLSQVALKIGSPGSPDFYQGTELWDFSLVDPDNRRPVDYAARKRILGSIRRGSKDRSALAGRLLRNWKNGAIKMYVTQRGLEIRKELAPLFLDGSYEPLPTSEGAKGHVCTFMRRGDGSSVVVAVPRLVSALVRAGTFPLGEDVWSEETIELPSGASGMWRNVYTDETIEASPSLKVADVFRSFPVAILRAEPVQHSR
ncbi:MAG: malto-oligosyltrehalose synthase [Thermoanaerobaculia bacterium]